MALDGARLFHVNVNCSDLMRSRAFYVDALGLTVGAHTATEHAQPGAAFGLDKARWDAWILLGERGYEGGAVDLLEWQEPPPTGTVPASLTQAGWQRFGFRVPDLDAAMAQVQSLGGAIWDEPVAHETGGHNIRIVLGNDPDGVALEIIEAGGPALSFVAAVCTDLERSLAFYGALGFEEVGEFRSEKDDAPGLRIAGPMSMHEKMLRAPGGGDVLFILVSFAAPPVVPAPPRPANTLGIWRTAFLVADLDATCAQLAGLGVTTISEPVEMAMGEGLPDLRFVCFAGPDGEVLELIEAPN